MAVTPVFQMRLDPELRRDCETQARSEGITLSEWTRQAMLAQLEVRSGTQPTLEGGCAHTERRILPYATFCKDCGERLR